MPLPILEEAVKPESAKDSLRYQKSTVPGQVQFPYFLGFKQRAEGPDTIEPQSSRVAG
jgi:hypothetical protein